MLLFGETIIRADEFLGPRDPAAFAAIASARVFPRRPPFVSQRIIIVAPRNPVGIRQMIRRGLCGLDTSPRRMRANFAINDQIEPHVAHHPLKDFDRIASRIDVHIENGSVQNLWQCLDIWLREIMFDKDINGLRARKPFDVHYVHIAIAIQIKTQAAHGVDRYAKISRPTGIIRVINVSAFTAHNFFCDLSDCLHNEVPSKKGELALHT
jgi:hypothetical protein